MTAQQFEKYTGENPVDVLGEDWELYVDDYIEELENDNNGEIYG